MTQKIIPVENGHINTVEGYTDGVIARLNSEGWKVLSFQIAGNYIFLLVEKESK